MRTHFLFSLLILLQTQLLPSQEVGEEIYSENHRYTLQEVLGEGAFGKVFKAVDENGKPFAIKYLKGSFESNSDKDGHSYNIFLHLMKDLSREYERGQLFCHPNIIRSHDSFSAFSEGKIGYYLVLEYVPGKSLHKTTRNTLTKEETIDSIVHLVDGLRHALDLGYAHLDLHDANVMVSESSDIMIIDLASFFSWEELAAYVMEEDKEVEKKGVMVESDVIRKKKLKEFFSRQPALFEALKEEDFPQPRSLSKEQEKQTKAKLLFQSYYFDLLTTTATSIVNKSNLDKETKLAIKGDIKKLAWSFEEDNADGLTTSSSLDDHLRELIRVIELHGNRR